jgi:hypothetical protein
MAGSAPSALPGATEAPRDPAWLAHRYDAVGDRVQFVAVDRARHRAITFLTDEFLPEAKTPLVLGRAAALAAALPPGPVHFIFHSAFCCSTLLVRALDREGVAMGLSEPMVLNDIMGWRHRGEKDGARVTRVLGDMLSLLARPFGPGEAVVVKPSNLVNPLAPAMLALRPEARALLLVAPLPAYLGSIARKGLWGRVWVRDLLVKLMREGMTPFGIEGAELMKLTDMQVAAVGWLLQQQLFAGMAMRLGERVRTLDSDRLMAAPRAAVAALADHYGLALNAAAVDAIVAGPAFTRHSKSGASFGAAERAAERDAGLAAHADEIDKVSVWAGTLAQANGIAMALPNPLLA